jgi:hypothetical protein
MNFEYQFYVSKAQITYTSQRLKYFLWFKIKKNLFIQFIILQTIGPMEVERPRALHLA